MKKHTLQEIADFTGCYVAKDFCGIVSIYDEKPTYNKGKWTAAPNKDHNITRILWYLGCGEFTEPTDAWIHDDAILVEPQEHKE